MELERGLVLFEGGADCEVRPEPAPAEVVSCGTGSGGEAAETLRWTGSQERVVILGALGKSFRGEEVFLELTLHSLEAQLEGVGELDKSIPEPSEDISKIHLAK